MRILIYISTASNRFMDVLQDIAVTNMYTSNVTTRNSHIPTSPIASVLFKNASPGM